MLGWFRQGVSRQMLSLRQSGSTFLLAIIEQRRHLFKLLIAGAQVIMDRGED